MKQQFCRFIYHRLLGWKTNVTVPFHDKCVLCAAPHTSNWDLLIGKLFYGSLGRDAHFMMKKEWFFFPLSLVFKAMGGIPVNRSPESTSPHHALRNRLSVEDHLLYPYHRPIG